ncbi:hypothetical protein Q5752_004934 [Cryptotrichosporon argae]
MADYDSAYVQSWEDKWADDRTVWDEGGAHAALVAVLGGEGPGIPRTGRALVPGCGRGYDVHLLASHGLDTVGLDVSVTGAAAARAWLATQPATRGSADVLIADFFEYDGGPFDVLYDLTFLCALPPPLRPRWAAQLARLAAPDATLITLQFPLDGPPGGPPFALSVREYAALLGAEWDEVWAREVRDEERRHGPVKAGERIAVWKRRRRE